MIELQWYFKGDLVGISETGKYLSHGSYLVPDSIIMFCQDCGDIWLKIKAMSDETIWRTMQRKCPKCGPAPLSIYEGNKGYKYPLPKEMDKYELTALARCGSIKKYEAHIITGGA